MFIYRSNKRVCLDEKMAKWIRHADADAILQDQGPSVGLNYSLPDKMIDGELVTYSVRISWEGIVHHRVVEFPSGERCEVKTAPSGEDM